jgi:hypothetical protein
VGPPHGRGKADRGVFTRGEHAGIGLRSKRHALGRQRGEKLRRVDFTGDERAAMKAAGSRKQ